jgi:hypothetical protein
MEMSGLTASSVGGDDGAERMHQSGFPSEPKRMVYLAGVLTVSVVVLWILPLWSSFWLDETITYWVVKDDLPALFRRSLHYNAQSPACFVVAWAAVAAGGATEWVLRIPSILAAAASTALVYRLGPDSWTGRWGRSRPCASRATGSWPTRPSRRAAMRSGSWC